MYRDIMCQGGIPFTGFQDDIAGKAIMTNELRLASITNEKKVPSPVTASLKTYLLQYRATHFGTSTGKTKDRNVNK